MLMAAVDENAVPKSVTSVVVRCCAVSCRHRETGSAVLLRVAARMVEGGHRKRPGAVEGALVQGR